MKQLCAILLILNGLQAYAINAQNELSQMIRARETPQQTDFFASHALVFFFASTCPHCHRQAPVLKEWAALHHASINVYSLDNKPLPDFPKPLRADPILIETAFKGESIRYPALFILNPVTGMLYPVAFGALSFTELNDRMQQIIAHIHVYEQRGIA